MHLEILRHSGPARLGKLHSGELKITTPNLFSIATLKAALKHEIYLASYDIQNPPQPVVLDYGGLKIEKKIGGFGILPDEHAGFRVPREFAELSVEKTVQFASKYPEHGAVIQGSCFADLRERCASLLAEHPLLAVANGEKLLQRPRFLAEVLPRIREAISPNSALYFPNAPPHLFALLAYMGVDFFDSAQCLYLASEGRFAAMRGILELNKMKELPCSCEVCRGRAPQDLLQDANLTLAHNFNLAVQAVREIREAIRSNSFRNLVEEKAACDVNAMLLLRLLDREKADFLERYTPVAP